MTYIAVFLFGTAVGAAAMVVLGTIIAAPMHDYFDHPNPQGES